MSAFGDNQVRYGKTVLIYIYLGDDKDTPPADEDYIEVAATRGFSRDEQYDTNDATHRGSGRYRNNVATFINGSYSIDGLTLVNSEIQRQIQQYFRKPNESEQNVSGQPNVWLKAVERGAGLEAGNAGNQVDVVTHYPSMIESFNQDDPFDDNSTWTFNGQLKSDPVVEEVADAPA